MLLTANTTLLFIAIGLISSIITFYLAYKMRLVSKNIQFFKTSFLRYVLIVGSDIAKSTIKMLRLIYLDNIKIDPAITTVNVAKLNKQEKVLFANLITMTPGTFVISVEGDDFLIHSVDKEYLNFKNTKITHLLHKMR